MDLRAYAFHGVFNAEACAFKKFFALFPRADEYDFDFQVLGRFLFLWQNIPSLRPVQKGFEACRHMVKINRHDENGTLKLKEFFIHKGCRIVFHYAERALAQRIFAKSAGSAGLYDFAGGKIQGTVLHIFLDKSRTKITVAARTGTA